MSDRNTSPSVGIMTYYRTGNYGGVLQAFALKTAINEYGLARASIIPYRADSIKGKINISFLRKAGIFRTAVALFEKIYYCPRMKKMNRFVDSFAPESELERDALPRLNSEFDIFLSGSDQIWNPSLQQGDFSYLLDFVFSDSKKRSYGSSFGVSSLPEYLEGSYRSLLSRYKVLTVREEDGANLVQSLIGLRPKTVLDPTLLLSRDRWLEVSASAKSVKPGGLFVYQLGASDKPAFCAKKYKRETGRHVDFVPFPIGGFVRCTFHLGIAPQEWLGCIRDADYVVADSFHAIVFSIIFHTNFYYVVSSQTVEKRLGRVKTLLDSLGLNDRIIRDVRDCDFSRRIDWSSVDDKLCRMREGSLEVLKAVLSNFSADSDSKKSHAAAEAIFRSDANRIDDEFFSHACTGCGACAELCPVTAISMTSDEQGFYRPVISDACVHCGKCADYCPANSVPAERVPRSCYIVSRNNSSAIESRSAGVFSAIADYYVRSGGVAYGVAMTENNVVAHVRVAELCQLKELSGSKYVQSFKGDCFAQVRHDLQNNRKVVFSGTPCEVAGLLAYLSCSKVDTDGLLTCDLICHGVPSPLVWSENLKDVMLRHGLKSVDRVSFRDGSFGQVAHIESYHDKLKRKTVYDNTFTSLFYAGLSLRRSCFECSFSTVSRFGDITLGDYWGSNPSYHPRKGRGVNTVFINSEKGRLAWNSVKQSFHADSVDLVDCIQPNLQHPSMSSSSRSRFWAEFELGEFQKCRAQFYSRTDRAKLLYRIIRRAIGC